MNQIWIDVCNFKNANPIDAKINKKQGKMRPRRKVIESLPYQTLKFNGKYVKHYRSPLQVIRIEFIGLRPLFVQLALHIGYRRKDVIEFLSLHHTTILYYTRQILSIEETEFLERYIKPSD